MTIKFTSIPSKTLSQAILSTGTTFVLNNIEGWDGVDLTSASFGTQAFGAFLSPDRKLLEFFSFDPSTIASASISFVDRGLDFTGANTVVTANKRDWPAGTIVMLGADVSQLLTLLMDLGSAQTVTGEKTFSTSPRVPTGGTGTQAANADDIAAAVSGASGTATNLVKGTVRLSTAAVSAPDPVVVGDNDTRVSTQGENDAQVGNNTDVAVGTGNKFVTQTGLQHNAEKYAVDSSGSSTAYVVTLSPAPTSLTAGMVVHAKIVNANTTTTPTINVNGLGAKTIVKDVNTALAVGDIAANQLCSFMYDGTNMVLQKVQKSVDIQTFTADGTWTKPSGAKIVIVECIGGGASGGGGAGGALANFATGGSGGGGGALTRREIQASDLAATVAVTVGAATTGGAGGTAANGSDGSPGNQSSFGTHAIGYGGGAGFKGTTNSGAQNEKSGGGGGGTGGVGAIGVDNAESLGGAPAIAIGEGGTGGAGGGGGKSAEYGGGGGGQGSDNQAGGSGGSSIFGAGGGGGGGGHVDSGAETAGGAGGNTGAYAVGGGGTAGAADGGAGGAGAAGSSLKLGQGGGGGGGQGSGSGGAGAAGGAPGGGGGGGGGGTTTGGAGGAGARGEVRVITYF